MKILFKNAKIFDGENEKLQCGCLITTDNKISYIGKEPSNVSFDKVIDCEGNLLMPGFKNAHAHGPMCFLRSASDDLNLKQWLFDLVFPLESKLVDKDIYYLTKLALIESLKSGITSTFEYYFSLTEMRKAEKDVGIRSANLITLSPTIPEPKTTEEYINLYLNDPMSNVKFGMHAEYTNSIDKLKLSSEIVHKYKIPFYTHCAETLNEVEDCKKRNNGLSPVEYLNSFGLFDYGGAIFHGVYLSEKDIKILQEHHVSVISCPGSNAKLASGICDLSLLQNSGINLGLGTDGPASNNSINIFKEMYLGCVLQKIKYQDSSKFNAIDMLKMATSNSAKAIGWNDCDSLKVGKLADLIMINLQDPSMQPENNILKNIVYAGSRDIVKMTMVNGKILYFDNKFFIDEDVDVIYKEVNRITKDILNR